MPCPAIRPHFFGACPKKRCRAAKEKRFFYLGGSTIRVSAAASVVGTFLARLGEGLGGCLSPYLRRGRTGLVMAALRGWSSSRVSLSLSAPAYRQKRVSLGLHPVSLRKSKEMGWNGQQGLETTSQRIGAHVPAHAHLPQSKTAVRGDGGFISRRCTPSRGSRARRGRSRGGGRPRGGRGCPPRARRRRRQSPASSLGTPRPRRPF